MTRALVMALVVVAAPALAQRDDDAPIPYGDEDAADQGELPKKSQRSRDRLREEEESEQEGEETLAHLDDPNLGVGGTFMSGLMLFESSRGGGVEPRFMYGLRFTWEWGRLIPDETMREMFFADVTWQYGALHEGTTEVNADTNLHYFTVSPAVCVPFGRRSSVAGFAQLGAGFGYDFSSIHIDTNEAQVSGTKFVFQYGLGLRGRPSVSSDDSVRIEWRVELTRFLRGYMHDTYVGAGVGVVF